MGNLNYQLGWIVSQGSGLVSNQDAYTGTQSVQLEPGAKPAIVTQHFADSGGEGVIFFDFYAKPVAEANIANSTTFTVEGAQFAYLLNGTVGLLEAFNGNGSGGGTWVPTNSTIPLTTGNEAQAWVRLTVRINFATKKWDLYAGGNMVAADLLFINNSSTFVSTFQAQGDVNTASYFDGIYIGTNNPMFADSNNDGIDDVWEAKYGLSLSVNDRYLNLSGDGVPIVLDYISGISPWINTKVVPAPVVTGLQFHLRSDAAILTDASGNVNEWFDQSGQGNNVAPLDDPSIEPLLVANAINGLPAVTFNGNGEFLRFPAFMQYAAAGEILAVVRVDPNPNMYNTMWQFGGALGSGYYNSSRYDDFGTFDPNSYPAQPASETTQFYFYNVSVVPNDWIERFNGVQITERVGDPLFFQGSPTMGAMKGAIAEMIVYNRVLSFDERETMFDYLTAKYALPAITVPPMPTNLTAIALTPGTVALTWTGAAATLHTVAVIQRETGASGFVEVAEVSDTNTFTDFGVTGGQTYTYQVSLRGFAGTSAFCTPVSVTTPTSAPIPSNGLQLWLRGDGGVQGTNGSLETWEDLSGLGNNAVQQASLLQPQVVGAQINGLPVVRFDGTRSLALPNLMSSAPAGEIMAVVKLGAVATSAANTLWDFGTSPYGTTYYNGGGHYDDFGTGDASSITDATATSQYFIYNTSIGATAWNYRYNGLLEWSRTGDAISFRSNPVIGAGYTGDVAEIIVYNRVLTDDERVAAGIYLNSKYALTGISVPPAPTGLVASVVSSDKVDLSWAPGLAGLHTLTAIERETGAAGFVQIAEINDGNGFVDGTVAAGLTYTYRIKVNSFAGNAGYSNTSAVTTPPNIPDIPASGIALWLRSTVGTQGVGSLTTWLDQSGMGNNAVQPVLTGAPLLVANQVNGLPIVRFNGSESLNLPNVMQNAQAGEIVAIVKVGSNPNNFSMLWNFGTGYGSSYYNTQHYDDFGTSDTSSVSESASPIGQYHVYDTSIGGGVSTYRFNGTQSWQRTGLTVGFQTYPDIGGYGGGSFIGDIAEIIVYNRVLTPSEQNTVYLYLSARYNIAAALAAGIPPAITSGLTATGSVGNPFSYQITASAPTTVFGATNLPTGLSLNPSTGLISGTPTAIGVSAVTLTATNALGSGSATLMLTIGSATAPLPVITSGATASASVGAAFIYQTTASNNPTSFGATGLPLDLSIDPTTGLISGIPATAGTFDVTLTAANASGTGTATLTLAIGGGSGSTPVISGATAASGTVGVAFIYQIAASNNPTSFGATGLPQGLAVNSATGLIAGTPTAAGTSNVTLTATNALGTGSATLTLAIASASGSAPVIGSSPSASGTVGSAFSYQITASSSPTSFGATNLPPGLSVNSGTGLISGTPTASGTSTVTLTATNALGTGSATLTLTIASASGSAPVIGSSPSATGTVGSAFSYQITASNSPTSFGATSLPPGLSVNSGNGLISGTPTAAGTSTVTLTAANALGTGSATLTLTIANASGPTPVISSGTTDSGSVSSAFSYQVTASNNPTSFGATGLPLNLVINPTTGLISGTPIAAGTFVVTLTAANVNGSGNASLTITVAPEAQGNPQALPYSTGFEATDGFAVGTVAGQNGWTVSQGSALISTQDFHSGSQSLQLVAGSAVAVAAEAFSPASGETIEFCDFYAKPVAETAIASSTIFTAEGAQFGFQESGGVGILQVFQGNGTGGGGWTPTSFAIPLGAGNQSSAWVRLTARLNFTTGTWDLYANGSMVAEAIPFINSSSSYFSIFLVQGDASTPSYIDDLQVGQADPLFADVNNDGIPDAWETFNGLSLSTSHAAGHDFDPTLTDLQVYQLGLNPIKGSVTNDAAVQLKVYSPHQ